jgi:hypothetical protein
MNYLEIVLQGYLNKNNRDFLDKYFYREFKKAQKENFYEADEFFNGCLDVVNFLKQDLKNKVLDRKKELLMGLEIAKNKTIPIKDLQGKSVEQKRKETIEYCKKELESETAYSIGDMSFTVNLIHISNGRYTGSLYNTDIENIELGIRKAMLRAYEENYEGLKAKRANAVTDIKKRILDRTADWRFFQIEVIADIEIDGKTYKNRKQRNNDSVLTPHNWEQHEDTFFKQRMETYPESYTESEKINLELEDLEKLLINETHYQILKDRYRAYLEQKKALPLQQNKKPKPKLNEALISFSSIEIIERLHIELKGYFQGKEAELKRALQGKQLKEFLLFPHNQNKFVEVFKRLKYNGFLLSTPKETKDWICSTFTYQYQKGNQKEVRNFNTSTVHDILTKDKGEPTKKERICIVDWLPYKSYLTRQREAENESI